METFIKMRNGLDYAHNKLYFYSTAIPNNPEQYAHLTPEDHQVIATNVQMGTTYFTEVQKKLQNAKLDADPPIKFEDMITNTI